MKEHNIFSNHILIDIYDCLIEGWRYSNKPNLIKQQAVTIIKQILLHKLLVRYNAPQWFVVTLTRDETDRLIKLLRAKYERLGQNKSDEELKQEAEAINMLFDKVVETEITKAKKEANNG